jgi:hypothetical protein
MAINAYPLTWPQGWKRITDRKNAQFSKRETNNRDGHTWTTKKFLSVTDGLTRILDELQKMGIDRQDVIVSSNVRTRLDGMPRSGEKEPADPGAAVYWQHKPGEPMRCMAIDRYNDVAGNLAAIAATLEAMRAIERHGGAEVLDRAFTGFKQLAAENAGPSWWTTLGVSAEATAAQINEAFRIKARIAHPDAPGGSREEWELVSSARTQGLMIAEQKGGK